MSQPELAETGGLTMAEIQDCIDRQQIHYKLMLYSHGIDRCDIDFLKQVFWPDGTCDYGGEDLNAYEWAEATVAGLSTMERTQHSVSNYLLTVDGDAAECESYCTAYHLLKGEDGSLTDMVVGGRYLDKIEKRDGEWRIASRLYVMDWNQNIPSTGEWSEGMLGGLNTGARAPDDHYYSYFK